MRRGIEEQDVRKAYEQIREEVREQGKTTEKLGQEI